MAWVDLMIHGKSSGEALKRTGGNEAWLGTTQVSDIGWRSRKPKYRDCATYVSFRQVDLLLALSRVLSLSLLLTRDSDSIAHIIIMVHISSWSLAPKMDEDP